MENIFNEPRLCRVCGVGSDVNKFVIKNGKVYGKRCLKCVSRQNNEKLKNKLTGNYYTEYYIKNKESFSIRDKARYQRNKALKNQVIFNFEQPNNNENVDIIQQDSENPPGASPIV
jgi:hypothetical protein